MTKSYELFIMPYDEFHEAIEKMDADELKHHSYFAHGYIRQVEIKKGNVR